MKSVFTILVLLCMTPVYAHAESDPFELPHPVTGEPGVWIPVWAQKIQLETDSKLKLCTDAFDNDQALIAEKNAEISDRVAAATALQDALKHTQEQLAAEHTQLEAAKSSAEARWLWAVVATSVAVVTGTILTLNLVH